MPTTSTFGFDISSATCCSPISASPVETSTLTRPFGPPAASLTLGVTSAAMPSLSNSLITCAAVMPPPAGAVWPTDFAASSARLSASAVDHDHVGRLAGDEPPGDAARWAVADADHVPAGALERRDEFVDRRLHGGGDQRIDLRPRCRTHGSHQPGRSRDRKLAHRIPPMMRPMQYGTALARRSQAQLRPPDRVMGFVAIHSAPWNGKGRRREQ